METILVIFGIPALLLIHAFVGWWIFERGEEKENENHKNNKL